MDQNTVLSGEPISLKRLIMGARNADGTYPSPVILYGATQVTFNVTTTNAQRYGDGSKRLASYTRITGGTISLTFAGDLSSIAVMLGITPTTSGTTPNRIRRFIVRNGGLPYVGIAGGIDLDDGTLTGVQFFAPKCQMTSDSINILIASGGEQAEFGTLTLEFTVLPDENYETGYEDEVQHLELGSPSAGNYTLTLGNSTTAAIAHDANAGAIEDALQALSVIGSTGVTVAAGDPTGFDITFAGPLASMKLPLLTGTGDGSFNGTIAITETTPGAEGEELIGAIYEVEAGISVALPPLFAIEG